MGPVGKLGADVLPQRRDLGGVLRIVLVVLAMGPEALVVPLDRAGCVAAWVDVPVVTWKFKATARGSCTPVESPHAAKAVTRYGAIPQLLGTACGGGRRTNFCATSG